MKQIGRLHPQHGLTFILQWLFITLMRYQILLLFMKTATKLLATVVTAAALFIGTNASAQSVPKSKWRFGVGVDGLLPVGSFRNNVNFGLGVTPRLQYGVADNVALTFTSGFYHFFTKPLYVPAGFLGAGERIQNDLDIIPVKAGIKAFISPNIYLGAEVGFGFEVDNGGGNTKFLASPGIGYASKKWDINLRYESFTGQSQNYGVLGLRVAYGFGL